MNGGNGQSGGTIFTKPKNTNDFRNILKNTLLRDFELNNNINTTETYFDDV